MQPVVTVGLDGSPESPAAARCAADAAEKRKLTPRLLHTWPLLAPEPAGVPADAPHLGPVAQAAIHHGRCPVAVVPHV